MGHDTFTTISRLSNLFWSKVDREGDNECWLWRGPKTGSKGYGAFCYDRKFTYAHRFSYMLHNGSIPDGKVVMHLCDHPLCVNPRHLALGSQRDNIHDSMRKGRWMSNVRKEYLARPPERNELGHFLPKPRRD